METTPSGSLAVSLSLGAPLHVPVCAYLCHNFDFLLAGSFMMEHLFSGIYSYQDDIYIPWWHIIHHVCLESSLQMNTKCFDVTKYFLCSFIRKYLLQDNNDTYVTFNCIFLYYKYTKIIKTDTITWLVTTRHTAVKTFIIKPPLKASVIN